MTPSAHYEKSRSLGFGGSMVARLKLERIDGATYALNTLAGNIQIGPRFYFVGF